MNPLISQWHTGELDVAQRLSHKTPNITKAYRNVSSGHLMMFNAHKAQFQSEVELLNASFLALIQLSEDDAFTLADTLEKKLLLRATDSIQFGLKLADPCMKRHEKTNDIRGWHDLLCLSA